MEHSHSVRAVASSSPASGIRPALRRALLAFCVSLAAAAGARAHDVVPVQITLRPGGEDYVFVADQGTCPATISVTSFVPGVTVQQLDMNLGIPVGLAGSSVTVPDRVDQVFIIRASSSITSPVSGDLEVCWVGTDWPGAPCGENNCIPPFLPHVVTVDVVLSPETVGSKLASGIARDPVGTHRGELAFAESDDLDLGGPFRLRFARYYASGLIDEAPTGSVGTNWLHDFEWKLVSTGNNVEIFSPSGRAIRFEKGFFASAWALALYEDVAYQLVQSGATFTLGDPTTGLSYAFDATGRLASVSDRHGNTHVLTYTAGLLTQVSDGLGRTLTLSYGGFLLDSVSDGTRSVSFGHTGSELTSVTDVLGKTTSYAYDASQPGEALLVSRTPPSGVPQVVQTFDASQRVANQTDAGGNPFDFSYDSAAGTTDVVDPLLEVTTHTHDANGRLTRVEDEAGQAATLTYDAKGRRASVTDRLGRKTSWTYHAASGRLASITEADGSKTTFGHAAAQLGGLTFYDVTSVTRADGLTEAFDYDASGNLVLRTDPAGNDWSYGYNARGQVTSATNPEGGVSSFAYNPDGTLDRVTDDAGNTTSFAYDALRRVSVVTRADSKTVLYAHDDRDRVTQITAADGAVSSFTYDDNGNLTSVTDPANQTWTFGYDALDRLESVADPLGNDLLATFDEFGRVRTVTDAHGHALTFGYDERGRLTSVADDQDRVWSASYDAEGVIASRTSPLSKTLLYGSDALGRITSVTSPLGHRSRLAYDALGRITSAEDPLLKRTTIAYGASGLPSQVSLPIAGATSVFQRNKLGQATAATLPAGGSRQYAYDAQGRRTSETDALGNATSYQYDDLNRLTRADLPGGLGTLDLTYDDDGRLVRRLHSDGTDLAYAYAADGRLNTASGLSLAYDAAGRLVDCNGIAIAPDAAGLVASLTLAPGKTISYAYDERELVTSVTDWVGGVTSFVYDDASRLVSLTRPNGLSTVFTHDDDDRLTGIQDGALASIALTRNARGDVTSASRSAPLSGLPALGTRSLAFDAAGQVSTFTYDALGRLLADGTRTYTWNLASHVTSYAEGANTVVFEHDAAGYVTSRDTQAGTIRSFAWNHALALPSISVVRENGADLRYYVHTPGGLLLHAIEASDDTRHFFHCDESGNALFLTDDAGAVTDSYAYGPYGELYASSGSFDNPFTWLGQLGVMREAATGLYHMRARVYDAATARFLSRDPIDSMDPRASNAYAYALGNPLRFADPLGTRARPLGDERNMQVDVETRFQSVEQSFLDDIGVDFGPPGIAATSLGALPLPPTPILSDFQLDLLLRATEAATSSDLAAAPRLTFFNATPANLSVVTQTSFVSGFDGAISQLASSPDPDVARPQAGVSLALTPRISADGRSITMNVQPSATPLQESLLFPRAPVNAHGLIEKFRDDADRRHAAERLLRRIVGFGIPGIAYVKIRDGNTLLAGGALVESVSQAGAKVPYLGDLPIIGQLFRSRSRKSDGDTILLVIQPRVLAQEAE